MLIKSILTVGMVLVGSIELMGFAAEPLQKFECTAQVPSTICGSGRIAVTVTGNDYEMELGDVPCWFADIKISGRMEFVEKGQHPYFKSEYHLFNNENGPKEDVLIVDYKNSVEEFPALLKIGAGDNQPRHLMANRYNLMCRLK